MDNLTYSHLGITGHAAPDVFDAHMREGARLYSQGHATEGAAHYAAAHALTGHTGKRDKASFDNAKHLTGAVLTMGAVNPHLSLVPTMNSMIRDDNDHLAADMLARRVGLHPGEAMLRVARRRGEMNLPPLPTGNKPRAHHVVAEIEQATRGHPDRVAVHLANGILHKHHGNMTPDEFELLAPYLHERFPVPQKGGSAVDGVPGPR